MGSSAGDGYGGAEEHYMYHVPQQSRREKLRFHHDDPNPSPFFPSSSSSSQNPNPSYSNYSICAPNSVYNQISSQNQQQFSLSLSTVPPRQQLTDGNNPTPFGPFTGYAEILNRSRFLEPARTLLEEICNVGGVVDLSVDRTADGMTAGRMDGRQAVGPGGGEQQQWKKTKLISMLDEVRFD